jgi:hypothetical protein
MHEARRLADVFRQIRRKGDDVVVGRFFDLVNPLDRKNGVRFNLLQSVRRNSPHLGVDLADGDLHVEPFLKFVTFGPESAHFGQRVACDHILILSGKFFCHELTSNVKT